jgi:penicillin-insensitive murein DD-endopeptidase
MPTMIRSLVLLICLMSVAVAAQAQSASEQAALAAMAVTNIDRVPAKNLFGKAKLPADLAPRAIGSYARGCLAGGQALPLDGSAWQVIALLERLAKEAKAQDGWNGLLVGDLAQPRGGPMLTGHASHQVGLDADVWLTPMPDRTLTQREREDIAATSMVKDRQTLDKNTWTEARARLIQRAASYPEVARIFVHPPIKAELCRWATGNRSWLAKVRPYFNHTYHFHIRMKCPAGMAGCKNQAPAAPKDVTGCGDELAYWMGPVPWTKRKRDPNAPPVKPAPPLTLSGLPAECRAVVTAP